MFNRLKNVRKRIKQWKVPQMLRNKYMFTIFIFLMWMIFFDQNNILTQYKRYKALREAKTKIEYFSTETVKTRAELEELMRDKKSIEKFAREKYYMKKPDEDVFVIIEK